MLPHEDRKRDVRVDLLSAGFGLGSWIAMTGLWVELPILVQRLPERWALASQLALILQIANVGPIIFGLCNYWWPNIVTERAATHWQLGIGALSTFLLIFFWTSTVSGISLAFFVLSFGLSLVDCTSSVVFLPFMANFRPCYLTPYLVGEGVSGLVPSLVAIAQGIENPECINETVVEFSEETGENVTKTELVPFIRDPRFSPEWFFAILLIMVLFSWLSFILLDKLPLCQKEKGTGENVTKTELVPFIRDPRFSPEWFFAILLIMVLFSWLSFILLDKLPLCQKEKVECSEKTQCQADSHEMEVFTTELQISAHSREVSKALTNKSTTMYLYLLFLQLWASIVTFGIFPALQPYSCLPYGENEFHLTVTLCGVAYPAACLLAMFCELRSVTWISWLSFTFTIVSLYALVTAILSPSPPLVGTILGSTIIVLCWVSFMFTFSYIKTMVTVLLGDYWGHDALFWVGAVTQGGAVAGALLMFLLVNVFHLFHDEDMCIA